MFSRLHGYPLSLVCHTLGALEMTLSTAHAAFSPPPSVPRQFRFHSRYAYPFLRAPSGAHRAELRACPSDPFPLEVPGPVSSRIPLDRMRFVKPARGLPSCSAFCRVTPVTPSPILGGEPALARLAAAHRSCTLHASLKRQSRLKLLPSLPPPTVVRPCVPSLEHPLAHVTLAIVRHCSKQTTVLVEAVHRQRH